MSDEERRLLRLAGLLHDIGKIGIPDAILFKPAPLTTEEWEVTQHGPGRGHLGAFPLAKSAGVLHHHERWDGSGYLDGLAGEDIPHLARILAVADAFSAMTTTRPYRKALTHEEALARIAQAAGTSSTRSWP